MNTPGADHRVLTADNVELAYGRRTVLRGASLEVCSGQRWFVIGPNGHGKTTLLRALLGLLRPTAGALMRHRHAMRPEYIGFVPQRCDLNPALPTTVREFVLLGLVGQKVGRADRHVRLGAALRQVHLESRIDADYFSLSGGQRQRALLARALIRRPRVLLLDEPTGGLDLTAQQALIDVLMERNRDDQMTLLFVTHEIALATRYATHVALVHDGAVHAGPAGMILRHDLLRRAYGQIQLPIEPPRRAHD